MKARSQPKSDKRPYASPTTPGLYIAARDYIIELVCLNVDPKIGPRFWSDQKYWAPKYKREVRGISNFNKLLDINDTLIQTALIQIIKEYRIKSLIAKKTIDRVVRLTKSRKKCLYDQRVALANKIQPVEIDTKKNSTFVDTGKNGVFSKIREAENG